MAEGATLFYSSVTLACVELVTDADLIDLEYLRQSQLEETKGRTFVNTFLRYYGRSY